MEIADERAHRCLSYAASVQRQGYKLTVDQFNEFSLRPGRRAGSLRLGGKTSEQRIQALARKMAGNTMPAERMLAYLTRSDGSSSRVTGWR